MYFIQVFGFVTLLWGLFITGINSSNSTNIYPKPLPIAAQSKSIPSDYFRFLDSYYKFHTSSTTWAEARRICEAEGAYLTIVNSEDEAYFLVRLFSQYPAAVLNGITCLNGANFVSIGFHDIFQEGEYVTIDGKSIRSSGYIHWQPGEPNNSAGENSSVVENCGSFHRNGGLNDLSCRCRIPFVCEIPVNSCMQLHKKATSDIISQLLSKAVLIMHFIQTFGILLVLCGYFITGFANETNSTSAIPKPLAIAAQSNSIPRDYVQFQNSYYKFHKDSQTWAEARRSCEAEGGHLAIVNSIEEEIFLIRLTRQYPPAVLNYVAYVNYFYIGFHDLFEEGDFVTVDGKSIRDSGYVNWTPGRPGFNNPSCNCGMFSRDGGLIDMPCQYRNAYICEISSPCNQALVQKIEAKRVEHE
ncbi:uncharacterized protein LOC123301094 [Chrysoperla carnea]|uniref:uncharacterized protein LOC123301094 n=1 Tax=Chrysoperla carnea TaxID=189513 RepID=UPI001D070973|nr:uncharacterized protein LOC123301094 [Chrysoperla carnea]